MSGSNEAREGGMPLELPIEAPELPPLPSTSERPAHQPVCTVIEIDLVTNEDVIVHSPRRNRHEDGDHDGDGDSRDRSRPCVIEISLV